MKKIFVIAFKECRAFAASPAAWTAGFVAISVFNVFFYLIVDNNREASLRDLLSVMEFMNIFFIPLLTMRLMAEEKSQGTMEFLLTSPTRVWEIVLGKFLGAWICAAALMSVVWIYYAILAVFAKPDPAEVFCGWAGLILESGFFIAVGMMVSSWTRHQLVAAAGGIFILFALFLLPAAESYMSAPLWAIVKRMGTAYHLESFASGFFGISDIVYYVAGIFFGLTVARYSAEHRLWN